MKKKKTNHIKTRIFIYSVISIFMFSYMFYFASSEWKKIKEKEKEEDMLVRELASLKDEEEKLESEISRLQDPEYLARYAREKYFYSKDDELIIRIPEDN